MDKKPRPRAHPSARERRDTRSGSGGTHGASLYTRKRLSLSRSVEFNLSVSGAFCFFNLSDLTSVPRFVACAAASPPPPCCRARDFLRVSPARPIAGGGGRR